MQFDPLNDALIKMYNAEQAGKFNVELAPASKLLGNVLEIMQKSGYVGSIDRSEDGRGGSYTVELRGAYQPMRYGQTPSQHPTPRIRPMGNTLLPAQDFGLLILTTNSGVMHHYDAKDARIGGKLLAYVY